MKDYLADRIESVHIENFESEDKLKILVFCVIRKKEKKKYNYLQVF